MEIDYLRILMLSFPVLAVAVAGVFALLHKRKAALRVITGGIALSLFCLFVKYSPEKQGNYRYLIAVSDVVESFLKGTDLTKVLDYSADGTLSDRHVAAALFVLAPALTVSNVLALFQLTVDRLRYALYPGTKYILSELNPEALALAGSIRREHRYAQIVFTGVGNPEKKHDTLLLEQARELNALCLKQGVTRLYFGFLFRKNRIFLISRNEPENVSEALALIEKHKNTLKQMDITVYAASAESRLAIDAADKGKHCLHRGFRRYLKRHLPGILRQERTWGHFARVLQGAPLEGRFCVRCVDVVELTVRNLLETHYKTIHKQAKAQDRTVGVTILGFGRHGAALLKNAAWIFQLYGYRLQFNIFDLDGSARRRLEQEAPELLRDFGSFYGDDASHDILFLGNDRGNDCFLSDFDTEFQKNWNRIKQTQLVFVSMGDDSRNIAAAIHVRELFQRRQMELALKAADLAGTEKAQRDVLKNLKGFFDNPQNIRFPLICAVVRDQNRAENLRACAGGEKGNQACYNYLIEPVGALDQAYDMKKIDNLKELEKSALKNHLCWSFKDVLTSAATQVSEETLKQLVDGAMQYVCYSYYRESSVATTLYKKLMGQVKAQQEDDFKAELEKRLEKLLAEEPKKQLNEESKNQLKKKLEQELKEELEKNLEKKLAAQGISCGNQSVATKVQGVTEHLRWNAYMRALGYRQYALRSDRVKLHPLIVPYHSLPQDEQTKDIIEFE